MTLTLNQVLIRLEALALSHKQINHFYFGDMVEWLANGEVKYPAVFVDMQAGSISKDAKQTGWDFEVWFCDLANVSESSRKNEMEVFSDLTSIAEDYRAMLEYNEFRDWYIGESSGLQYFKEKFEDITYAIRLNVHIGKLYDSNRCQIPSTFIFETDPDMPNIVNNYIYVGTGEEGNSLTVGSLQEKMLLMVFKGDKTLTPGDDPDNLDANEYYKADKSALITFGTDIENGQVIQLLNR